MSPTTTPPTIDHPLRLLYLSPPETPTPAPLQGDTLSLSTPYYSAAIPIWHDTLSPDETSISDWRSEWLASEAGEVVQNIGAWIIGARKPASNADLEILKQLLSTIKEVIEHHSSSNSGSGEDNTALRLVLGLPQPLTPRLALGAEEWDDIGRECGGWEWIDGEMEGGGSEDRNVFGERIGLARLREALETNEWESPSADTMLEDELELGSEESLDVQVAEDAEEEGMHEPMLSGQDGRSKAGDGKEGRKIGVAEDEEQVEGLESMMLRIQAIKDMGADMPETERKKFAANAVREAMKRF